MREQPVLGAEYYMAIVVLVAVRLAASNPVKFIVLLVIELMEVVERGVQSELFSIANSELVEH